MKYKFILLLGLFIAIRASTADMPELNAVNCSGVGESGTLLFVKAVVDKKQIEIREKGQESPQIQSYVELRHVLRRINNRLIHFYVFDFDNGGFLRIRTIDQKAGTGLLVRSSSEREEGQMEQLNSCELLFTILDPDSKGL